MTDGTREIFGYIATIISLCAYPFYIVEYIGGRTKTHSLTSWMWKYFGLKGGTSPRQSSWLIWAVLQYVIFVSSREQGVTAPAIIALGYLIGSATNTVLLFWYGSKKWERLDYLCAFLAVMSIFLLYQNKELAFWALALAITTDAIAAIPTVYSVTKTPSNEGRVGWTIFLIGALVNLFTINHWNFQEAGFTIYLILVIGYVTIKVWFPKKQVIYTN